MTTKLSTLPSTRKSILGAAAAVLALGALATFAAPALAKGNNDSSASHRTANAAPTNVATSTPSASPANSIDDDTADQGRGDAPGTPTSTPSTSPANSIDDDGTADQGRGDAPGTPGSPANSIDDDGTADQGSGDAPGTPGAGMDDDDDEDEDDSDDDADADADEDDDDGPNHS